MFETLSDSEFRFLADAVPVKVWRSDSLMNANYYNQEWYDYTGKASVEELKAVIWSMIHPEDLEAVREAAQLQIEKAAGYDIELRFRNKDGVYRWHKSTTKPVFDEQNRLMAWLGVCTDIQDEKRSLEDASRNEEYFRFLADNTPTIIWQTDFEGGLTYVSKQWESFSGLTAEDGFDRGWKKLQHPDDEAAQDKTYTEALSARSNYSAKFRMRRRDGEYCWFLSVGLPVFEGGIGYLGTLTDITEQENAHQQSSHQLKKMDEFVSIASHELKTPLTSLKLCLQLLDKGSKPGQEQFISRGLEQLKRLERLTSDLLDVSKISAGKLIYNLEEIQFDALISECKQIVESLGSQHQVIIKNIPHVKLQGDRHRLEQVLANILSNAVKYSPGSDKIVVDAFVQNNYVVTSVQDFGIGIAEEDLAKIFQRFYRVDATAMKYEGLGLGLFIVSEILIRHKGDFWIESQPGLGSTFFFKLPLQETERTIYTDSQTAYRDTGMSIYYDSDLNMLRVDWIGFQDFESVKYGCLKMYEMLKNNGCKLVLNDNTNITGVSDAAEWVGAEWFPMMEGAGLTHFAWVFSTVMFNNISAQKAVDLKQGSVITRFFTSCEEAQDWLLSAEA